MKKLFLFLLCAVTFVVGAMAMFAQPIANEIMYVGAVLATAPVAMTEEQISQVIAKVKAEFNTLFKETGFSKEEVEEKLKSLNLDEKLKGLVNNEEFEKVKADLVSVSEQLTKLKSVSVNPKTWKNEVQETIKEKHQSISDMFNSGAGVVEIFKAKADNTPDILTTAVTTSTGGNALLDLRNADDKGVIRLRDRVLEQYVSQRPINKESYVYSDILPVHLDSSTDGIAEAVTEGNTKPKVAMKWEVRTATAKKVAAYEIISEEAKDDIVGMSAIATEYLRERVLIARNNSLVTLATSSASAFDSTTWTQDKVTNPNLIDCVVAAINQVVQGESWQDDIQFMPNVAFVNYGDFLSLSVRKDKNEAYLWAEGIRQKLGVNIVPLHKNDIASGKILVGDFSKLEVFNYIPYNVRMGWINDQLITNQFTMVGETRFIELIRNYNKRAFVYDDISDIQTAIQSS